METLTGFTCSPTGKSVILGHSQTSFTTPNLANIADVQSRTSHSDLQTEAAGQAHKAGYTEKENNKSN